MTKDNTKSKYSLIRLTLQKKWNVASGEHDLAKCSGRALTVLGYYDRLIYENIGNWYALRPGIINMPSSTKEFSDEYTLRLVAPDWVKNKCEKEKTLKGIFDYAYFDRFGANQVNQQEKASKTSTERFPIFSVLLINCSDEELKKISNVEGLFGKIYDAIVGSLITSDSCKLKIGIFLSLGYSEFAVLLSGNSVRNINRLIDEIRLRLLGECASSTYTILGFDETLNDSAIADETIDATIDFSMAPGKRLDESDFLQFFVCNLIQEGFVPKEKWTELNTTEWEKLRDEAQKHSYSDPVMLMGAIDWRWELKGCKLAQFLHVYKGDTKYDGKLKSFGNNSNLFKAVHTKLPLKRFETSSAGPENFAQEKINNPDDKKFEQAYQMFETLYEHLIAKYYVHRRSFYAMRRIKYLYDKVVSSSYGGDVRKLTKPFFHDFLDFMNGCMNLLLNSDEKAREERQEFLKKAEGIDTFLREYIKRFRDFFEPYLFAIYRSDHAFFEGQSLVHPSIGSAAKLLFCYNQVLYSWEEKYCEWETKEIERNPEFQGTNIDFTYLVTSGGVDSTDNWDIFDYISDFISTAESTRSVRFSRPLVVMMSEAGLYNIEGTLFKLAHEFFHKRGKRMREQRAQAYIKDICYHVADRIAYWFVDDWLQNKIYDRLYSIIAFDKRNEAQKEKAVGEEIYQKTEGIFKVNGEDKRCKFKKDIIDALVPVLFNENVQSEINAAFEEESQKKWYGRNLLHNCKEILYKAWKLDKNNKDKFWDGYTYKPNDSDQRIDTLRKKIACKLYELGKQISDNVFLPMAKDKTTNGAICEDQKIFILRPDFEIDSEYIDESLFTFDRKGKIEDTIKLALRDQNEFATWERLAKECFADCLAIKTMVQNERDPNDSWGKEKGMLSYLLAYLFEGRNPNEQWEINYSMQNKFWAYRILIIKELLKWNSGPEGKALEKMIGTWYDACFYPGRHESGDRANYVGDVAAAWINLKKEWTPDFLETLSRRYAGLMQYLNECINDNESLCQSMREVHVSVLRNEEDTIKAYSEFVFEKWMEIYRENAKGEANG